tara:strand:+ start:328 stop:540 length:213 start_codon:yes stop_codon:yes gene_type:complete
MSELKDISKKHFYVSLTKSLIRIFAAISLIYAGFSFSNSHGTLWPEIAFWLKTSGALLLVAEILGIAEEF